MLAWILRGLRCGVVTTGYPARPHPAPAGFHGPIDVAPVSVSSAEVDGLCPTDAISVHDRRAVVDRGRCIGCGACVEARPHVFAFAPTFESAARRRSALVVGETPLPPLEPLRATLAEQVRALRHSVHVRHVDTGSDGSEEWEIAALTNPYYDAQRLGIFFTSAPRHADVLLVTGGVTRSMELPLRRTYEAMPSPKAVVAAGSDACSGGFAVAGGDVLGGVDQVLPVDVYIPGSPPSPIALLHGLLLAIGVLREVAP